MTKAEVVKLINRHDLLMSQKKLTTREKREKRDIVSQVNDYINKETKLNGKWEEMFVGCPYCENSSYVYVFEDNKTCYCLACGKEFDAADVIQIPITDIDFTPDITDATTSIDDAISDDPKLVEQLASRLVATGEKQLPLQLPKTTYVPKKTGVVTYGYSGENWNDRKTCFHTPRHVISGEGWGVWAGRKIDCRDEACNFDIVLNLTWGTVKEHHNIPIPELRKYESVGKDFTEVKLDWPDYGAVRLPREFWEDLIKYAKEHKQKILVFCEGGHGRTGTAVACMMIVGLGYTPRQAVRWIRKNYCGEAIESIAQVNYIESIYKDGESKNEEKALVQIQN